MIYKEVINTTDRIKDDTSPDEYFYSMPRYSYHLDQNFREKLSRLYSKELNSNSILLDFMSSWKSHLPDSIKFKRVLGHGLNKEELNHNDRLDFYWIQNININQNLPLEDCSIDHVLIVAGWQYLQFPEKIASELYRITKPGGKIIVSFSNRAFWSKCPSIWKYSDPEAQMNYIINVLEAQNWSKSRRISERFVKNPFLRILGVSNDPFYCVIASR